MRRFAIPAAKIALLVVLVSGCASAERSRGNRLFELGDYEGAAEAYRKAIVENPDDPALVTSLEAAERRASGVRYQRGLEHLAAGDLPRAVAAFEDAVRLDSKNEDARAALARERPRLEKARATIAEGRRLLEAGDAIAAERRLAGALPWTAGFPELDDLYRRARRGAAASLRERAAKRLAAGEVAGANADLALAKGLEAGTPAAAPADGAARVEGGVAAPAPEDLLGAPALDAYAQAAAEVKRLTEGLPRRRGEPGLARPEDYAIAEERIAELRLAIERALATKPAGERQPQWLAHGRLVLTMSIDVAVARRLERARKALEAEGGALAAYRDVEVARALDRNGVALAPFGETVRKVRMATARALLEAADRANGDGLHALARLRARQAVEVDPAASRAAAEVIALADAKGGAPAIALLPFQNYTTNAGIEDRLYARLLHRLESSGAKGVLSFDLYRKRKEAGRLPPLAAIARGDVKRFEVSEKDGDETAIRKRIAALTEKARAARRRLLEASTAEERRRAEAEADEAERLLARAERERAASLFASSRAGETRPVPSGERPVEVTLEARMELHDPLTGNDFHAEAVVRHAEGRASDLAALEAQLLEEAVGPLAKAVEDRLRVAASAARDRAALDPRAALDAQIAELEREGVAGREATANAVLEATGYSFVERRTIPVRLRID